MIVGLLRPSSGTIRLCGHDVAESNSAANRLLGYVPDVPYLYDKLSGREFLQFIAEMYGLDRRELAAQIPQQVDDFRSARLCRRPDRKLFARHEAAAGFCRRHAARSRRCW